MKPQPIHKLFAALVLSGAFVTADAAVISMDPGVVTHYDLFPSDTISFDILYDFSDQPTLGGSFDVFFPSSALAFGSYTYGGTAGDPGFARDPDIGDGVLIGISFGDFNGISDAGHLGTLVFEVVGFSFPNRNLITMADNDLPWGPFVDLVTFQPIDVDYLGVQIIPIPAALWLMICGTGMLLGFGGKKQ